MQGLPQTPPASNETSGLVRAGSTTTLATEGRPLLSPGQTTTGQVVTSEPLQQGQGHRVQVQLSNGQQINLISDKPFPEGQQLQLTGRAEGQVEVRVLSQAAIQQLATSLISQMPAIKVQLATGQTLPLQPGQASRAEVIASQPNSGQGYTLRLELSSGQQVSLVSERPLPVASQVHLNANTQGGLEVRALNREVLQLLDQLKAPLTTALPSSASRAAAATPSSLESLLASASAQLRHALPRQAPLGQVMQQLTQLVKQLPASGSPQTPSATRTAQPPIQTQVSNPTTNLASTQATNVSSTQSAAKPASSLLANLNNKLTAALNLVPQGNQTPSASSLQQFIPFSGLLLEANLLRGVQTNPAGGDLKLLLQQASSLLREGLANPNNSQPRQQQLQQLAQQVQSAESRIQVMQQTSLQATQATHERGQPAQIVQMDLPYSVRGEWFQAQLEIRRWIEEKDAEAAIEEAERRTRSWEVNLSFTLKNWGKIHTLLRLKDEQLKADIWVEVKESYLPIKKQAEVLAARLRRIGADVEEVTCHLGEPPPVIKKAGHQHIIDTRI
ncbi:flagellar hook-length control protein FliK [Marinospirillum insulare]|uniref:Flagellar hook-length control protein-like C-terminal domain-containing protein n=1 Tax=Marinospirillum insulare TaxID=217169 RepID=A0ABQ5ZWP8_9GAMM|nr:flagellar hook-length control protein FliK [Marinospirillum insulare]GLR63896.1 hypothetical protein GCM10007878_13330 [Marinospirillum insulare]